MTVVFNGYTGIGKAAIICYMDKKRFVYEGKQWRVTSCIAVGDDVKVEIKEW